MRLYLPPPGVSYDLRKLSVGDRLGLYHTGALNGSLVWHVDPPHGVLVTVADTWLNRLRCWWKRRHTTAATRQRPAAGADRPEGAKP